MDRKEFQTFKAFLRSLTFALKPSFLTLNVCSILFRFFALFMLAFTDRMPVLIGNFISKAVYNSQLQSYHKITNSACFFVDVSDSAEKGNGTSWEVSKFTSILHVLILKNILQNIAERRAVCKIAASFQEEEEEFRIITPYDAQRTALESDLKEAGLDWHNKCFNVDSFQGKSLICLHFLIFIAILF